ncbi:MAG: hypothetical protein JSU66_07680 [Deltaproteobacteria bacterium]|nr:MAG: hypothetical protein JSU66_07680 [Deltaproteobacteria bacterium]
MTARIRNGLAGLLAAPILWLPRVGWACAVCSAGRDDETRVAFILTTALLTFLPLGMIAGLLLWLRRRARRLEADSAPRPRAAARRQEPKRLAPVSPASSSL